MCGETKPRRGPRKTRAREHGAVLPLKLAGHASNSGHVATTYKWQLANHPNQQLLPRPPVPNGTDGRTHWAQRSDLPTEPLAEPKERRWSTM